MQKAEINTLLFDLDGTLLPLGNDEFEKLYFHAIDKKLGKIIPSPIGLLKTIWLGTLEMLKNNGSSTNEEVFWKKFKEITNRSKEDHEQHFTDFYLNEFIVTKNACYPSVIAKKIIDTAKKKGYKVVLATNPLFPLIATKQRIEWAGLSVDSFELVTTYENSSFCKPNLKYYEEILSKINKTPEECMMIGNDINDDMVVSALGIKTYLVTDCLINTKHADLNLYHRGSLEYLLEFIESLPKVKSQTH